MKFISEREREGGDDVLILKWFKGLWMDIYDQNRKLKENWQGHLVEYKWLMLNKIRLYSFSKFKYDKVSILCD